MWLLGWALIQSYGCPCKKRNFGHVKGVCVWGGGVSRWLSGKNSTANAGDTGLIPGLKRSPGERNGNPLQYSCLENPMNREPSGLYSSWGCKELYTVRRPPSASQRERPQKKPTGLALCPWTFRTKNMKK